MLNYCIVKQRIGAITEDSPDDDNRYPDYTSVFGQIVFAPTMANGSAYKITDEDGVVHTVPATRITAQIVNGEIVHEGVPGLPLFAAGPNANPSTIVYTATYTNLTAAGLPITLNNITFRAVPGETIDLSSYTPVAGAPTPGIIQGPPGHTPYIGSNGNWWISSTDTGVAATSPLVHSYTELTEAYEENTMRVKSLEAMNGVSPESPVDGQTANLITQSDTLTREALDGLSEEATDASTTWGRNIQQAQVAPYLVPLVPRFEPRRYVLVQGASPSVAYAERADGGPGRPFDKTDDGGLTWTQQGNLPFAVTGMIQLASGTFLGVEDIRHAALGNARLTRSTDDGQSWQVIDAGFRLPPISQQGMCEGTDGSVGIAEYGNIGNTVYRILRSTDDGLTWTTVLSSDGVEPIYDPGHFHSLTYDPVEKCHISFQDRPDNVGFDGPRIWISRDNMATWSILASSVDWDHPNFVSPMYFKNYIAWGSDNQINGRISRMKRSDFYSGDWMGKTEHVYQTDQKCLYYTHPLREDVWLVSTAIEHIKSSAQDGRIGSYAPNILVVDQDGARVSGGLDAVSDRAAGNTASGRFRFPSLPLGHVESDGWGWIDIRGTGSVPVTQGWSPPTHIAEYEKNTVVREYQDLMAKNITGETFPVARTRADYFEITNGKTGGHAAIRVSKTPDASITFRSKGADVAYIRPEYDHISFRTGFGLGNTAQMQGELLVRYGQTPPEGVVTARGGSLYMCWGSSAKPEDTGLWIKSDPNIGSTGWTKATVSGVTEIPVGGKINIVGADDTLSQVAVAGDNYLALAGGDGVNNGPSIRIPANASGNIELRAGSQVVGMLQPGLSRIGFRNGIGLGNNGQMHGELGILYGEASPEGVVSARGGSIYLCHGSSANPEPTGIWVKENPNMGSTGWVKK